MNDYQLAIKSIREAKAAGRLPELRRKVLEMSGVGNDFLWITLANIPSRYTKSWASLNREMPKKPPALIRGGDFDLRRVKPISLHGLKLYECGECHEPVKAVGITGACVKCQPGSFSIGVNQEVVA